MTALRLFPGLALGWLAAMAFAGPCIAAAAKPADAAAVCVSCHGVPLRSPDGGDYNIPRLRGQEPLYMARVLEDYRQGRRSSAAMRGVVDGLAGVDLAELARLVSGPAPGSAAPPKMSSAPGAVTRVCGGCHGIDGRGRAPEYPSLAGQDAGYLRHAMTDYAAGRRPDAAMRTAVQKMPPAEIQEVADYYARLPGLGQMR